MAYLLSLPDDWELYLKELQKHSTDGRDSTASALKELLVAGYVSRTRSRTEEGRFVGWDYVVHERPPKNGKAENGKPEFGETENGKPTTTNNNLTNKDLTNKDELENSSAPEDKFKKVPGLKSRIGPKHYELLNKVCLDEGIYILLKSLWSDKRFEVLCEFLEYKKEIRSGYKSPHGIRKQIQTFADHTYHELREALDQTIRSGWQSINPKKNRGKVKPMFRKKQAL